MVTNQPTQFKVLTPDLEKWKSVAHRNFRPAGSLPTRWALHTYDVWGNAKDGYEVNDVYSDGEIDLRIPQTRYNIGTPAEFVSACPSDRQIKLAFGVHCRITTDGDDMRIEVERERDGYPIGNMECISHASLSPVRKTEDK